MNYRKICTFVLLCFGYKTAYAENGVVLHQLDGTTITYAFSEEPKVTYNGDTLVMSAAGVVVEYPLVTLKKLSFTEALPSSIETPLIVTSANGSCQIYTIGGQLIRTIPESSPIATSGLPVGIYIIRNNKNSYKINISR